MIHLYLYNPQCDIYILLVISLPSRKGAKFFTQMFEHLIKQASAFMNSLYGDVECSDETERNSHIWQANNSLYFIVNYVKKNRIEPLDKFYESSRGHPSFNSLNFFLNVLSLIRLGFQVETCKSLLACILVRQKQNQLEFVKHLPPDLFQKLFNYNPATYQRGENKVKNKGKENRIERICDSTQGYSEVMLAITVFLQNGVIKRSHQETWDYILVIVGRHNLDFHKVIDIMLAKIVERIDDPSTHEQLAILENIDFNSFFALVSKNICRVNQEWPNDLVVSGSIFSLVNQSPLELYEKHIHYYNPKYLSLIAILITRGKFQAEQFVSHFYCLTAREVMDIELQRMNAVNQIMSQVFYVNSSEIKPKNVFGQALHCFRLALMAQFIKANNFASFQRLYTAFYPEGRFDIIIHAPLIRELCMLIEWMVDPLFYNNSHSHRFKECYIPNRSEKSGGYFRQYNEANRGLFQDLQLILSYLQINIGFHVKPFVKLLRVFTIILKDNSLKIEWNIFYEFKGIIKQLTKMYLLPAATLHQGNPAVSWELNALLQLFPQEDRFEIYEYYFHTLLFWNPYLAYLFQKVTKYQYYALKELNFQKLTLSRAQLKFITKIQHNQCFQSSFYLLKRGLTLLSKESEAFGQAIGASTLLSGDVMMYLSLNHLTKCVGKAELQKLGELIYYVLLYCPSLDLSLLVKFLLKRMRSQNIEEFENSMNILHYLLEKIFPSAAEFGSKKFLLDFLTYGYHLKLDTMDKIKDFNENRSIRKRLHKVLSSKMITSSNTQHSILYQLINVLMNRINSLLKEGKSMHQTGDQLDACMNVLTTLTYFHAYQTNRIRQQNHSRILQPSYICFTQNQFKELIRDSDSKVPMAIICRLLRTFRKLELFSSKNSLEPIPIKRLWDKIYKDYFFNLPNLRFQASYIDPAKSTHFIHSDFYLFFWTSDIENIWLMDEVYQAKVDDLRRIISKDDIFQVNNTDLDTQNKNKYILAFKMLEKQREELKYYYDKFNVLVPTLNAQNKPLNDRISKVTIPPLFIKQKDEESFNDFVSLFFLQCILPRMITDQTEAIFCSKMVFKVIKENKLPSNKSLMMIFSLLEAAISYIPNSTLRETRCIAIFTSDFLRIFSEWDKMDELSFRLQNEINIEKFNDKRYEKLKGFLQQFQVKFIDSLLRITSEIYIVSNCLQFLQINEYLPYSQGQVQRINKHLSTIKFEDDHKITINIKRIVGILENRKKRLGSFATLNYEKQLKKYAALSQNSQSTSTSKPKIYKEQQMKKCKQKQYISLL